MRAYEVSLATHWRTKLFGDFFPLVTETKRSFNVLFYVCCGVPWLLLLTFEVHDVVMTWVAHGNFDTGFFFRWKKSAYIGLVFHPSDNIHIVIQIQWTYVTMMSWLIIQQQIITWNRKKNDLMSFLIINAQYHRWCLIIGFKFQPKFDTEQRYTIHGDIVTSILNRENSSLSKRPPVENTKKSDEWLEDNTRRKKHKFKNQERSK